MILIKSGVVFKALKPQIYGLFPLLDRLWKEYGLDCVVTSAADGKHMAGSKHYTDEALDLRSKNLPSVEAKKSVLAKLNHELGGDYDVLLEKLDKPGEHFHIEWDPK